MKAAPASLGLALLLSGCSSLPPVRFTRYGAPPRAAVVPAAINPPGQHSPAAPAPITTPSIRKAYYVGPIIDPAHPELLYRPGIVYREELPERWNQNAQGVRGAVTGTISSAPDPAILPPSSPEQQQLIAQQQRVMQLLAESNSDLTREVADLRDGKVEQTPAAPLAEIAEKTPEVAKVPKSIPTAEAALDLSRALVPNADGAIELSPEILDEVDRTEPNPFVKRYQPQATYRQMTVEVTGTSSGPRPTASINGRLVNVGDAWESFVVAAITRDAVYLRKDAFLLQIPIARQRAVTLRMPP